VSPVPGFPPPIETLTQAIRKLFGKANGITPLDGGSLVDTGYLGSGTASSTKFLRGDRTWATPTGATLADGTYADVVVTGSGATLTVTELPVPTSLTSDATFTSSTLANSGMSFTVATTTYYNFRFMCMVQTSDVTVGPKFGVTHPGATTFIASVRNTVAEQGDIQSSGGSVQLSGLPIASTSYLVTVEGTILTSSAGTVHLQMAREGSSGTITLKQGSMTIAQKAV